MNAGLLGYLQTEPIVFFLLAGSLMLAISMHEFSHALAADLQGDRLPRAYGRLTLNPARHLDPLGSLCILLVGFGWGKPVEFRPGALRSKRFGAAIVALAGPAMNLLLAFMGAVAFIALWDRNLPLGIMEEFLLTFTSINVLLAVFNLIPLPPLDGSRLLTIFLPPGKQHVIYFLDRYGFLILLALVFFGGTQLLVPLIDGVTTWLLRLAGL